MGDDNDFSDRGSDSVRETQPSHDITDEVRQRLEGDSEIDTDSSRDSGDDPLFTVDGGGE